MRSNAVLEKNFFRVGGRDVTIPIPFGIDIDIDPFHLKNETSTF
jgi:hypothetical protein